MSVLRDDELISFVFDLDESGLEVTCWEADFIESIMTKQNEAEEEDREFTLSEKQRDVIGRLQDSYSV